MKSTLSPAARLSERLCRPQRIGVFGRRGAGKTTLLTMFYREAVGGRLPNLRLAAADARTANYLADKVLQLEAGEPLPATLGETELRFHLYYQNGRVELLFKDYQGEHVALGRQEPIREFLRDCDAVWLCLDVGLTASREPCLRAEQEVEQMVEDYLGLVPDGSPHRPMALLLTKADLLTPVERYAGPQADAAALAELVDRHLGMTRHTLAAHSPVQGVMAVSSLGHPFLTDGAIREGEFTPRPIGLAEPLAWLFQALQAQDEARLAALFEQAGNNVALIERAVACFARRYPNAPTVRDWKQRLQALRRRRFRRRLLAAAVAAVALVFGLWTYDAVGQQQVDRFAALNGDDPEGVKTQIQAYQSWHPLRHLFNPSAQRTETERLRALDGKIEERRCQARLAELRRRAGDPDADAVQISRDFERLRADFPDYPLDDDLRRWDATLKARAERERNRRIREAVRELDRLESLADLKEMVLYADRFLHEYPDSVEASGVEKRRQAYLARLDERDLKAAADYSAQHPRNFQTRREKYQQYLERHPQGAFVSAARQAIEAVEVEWDRHDFRAVRDHYTERPGDLKQLDALCRAYLTVHPQGRYSDSARQLLRWSERAAREGEYRVTVKRGDFDPKANGWLSAGLNLSVELEVNGVFYGPSTVVRKSASPTWDYEFPKRVRWKRGDSVKVRVVDHYYWRRTIVEFNSDDGDPLAMRLLSGETRKGKHSITFVSNFDMPVLPRIE